MAKYEWSEIFMSLEGEAKYSGHPTVYIRFARCNFQCAKFNNPENQIERDGYATLDFKPSEYKTLQELPIITRGCDSQYSVNDKFSHMWQKGDEKELAAEVLKVLPHNTFVNPATGRHPILSLSVHEDENVLALENGKWIYKPIKDYWSDSSETTITDNVEQQSTNNLYCHVFDNGKATVKPVAKMYRHKADQLHKITTQFNYNIRVTGSHSLMVLSHDGTIKQKPCNEIVPGDYLLTPKTLATTVQRITFDLAFYVDTDRWEVGNTTITSKANKSTFPRYIDNSVELSELVGYYVAEGSYYVPGRRATFSLGNEPELAKRIETLVQTIFNHKCDVDFIDLETLARSNDRATQGRYVIGINNKIIAKFLADICGEGANNKKVPDFIFVSTNEAKARFLAAVIEGDGGVRQNLKTSHTQIMVASNSQHLLDGLMIVGRMIGLKGRFETCYDKAYSKNRSVIVFSGNTNIVLLKKQLNGYLFSKIAKMKEVGAGEQNKMDVHFSGIPIKLLQLSKTGFNGNKRIRREKCELLLHSIKTNIHNKQKVGSYIHHNYVNHNGGLTQKTKTLENLLKTTEQWDLVEVTKNDIIPHSGYVYDFEVPEHHTFIAGSGAILSHNTGGEPTIRLKFWIPILEELYQHGMRTVLVETNCAAPMRDKDLKDLYDWAKTKDRPHDFGTKVKFVWSNSPKLSNSGESWASAIRPEIAFKQRHWMWGDLPQEREYTEQYFKFVCGPTEQDFQEVQKAMEAYYSAGISRATDVYIMPQACTEQQQQEISTKVAKMCIDKGYIYCHRIQNSVFGNGVGT